MEIKKGCLHSLVDLQTAKKGSGQFEQTYILDDCYFLVQLYQADNSSKDTGKKGEFAI